MLTFILVTYRVQVMEEVKPKTKESWLSCDRCCAPMPPELWQRTRGDDDFIYADEDTSKWDITYEQTSNGMTLAFEGGYGMFIDDITPEDTQSHTLHICHECTIIILQMFPKRIRERFMGGHPAYKDAPKGERCCEYSWCFSDYPDSE